LNVIVEGTQIKTTNVFKDIIKAWVEGKRRILLEGGTYSTKTWSTIQALMYIAEMAVDPLLISIVSESLPHLKQGAMKDFFDILGEPKENNPHFNMGSSTYSRSDWKGRIEFFGADSEGKALGPRRDILFINQGEHIRWETARHLDTRTEIFTIVDWNPISEFWVHEHWRNDPRNAYNHSTYQDAKGVISQDKIDDIESYRDTDPNYWRVFGLGLIGKIEGLVHPFFKQVEELPDGEVVYGLDFGFSVDPTVLTKNVIVGDKLYSQELIYETGLTNDAIARKMDLLGVRKNHDEIFADSAEPKSIQEIYEKGFNIKPCEKGPGSVEYGIQKVNQYEQYWTEGSLNCIKDQYNFSYILDKDGKLTDKTTHRWSHGMDSRRYAVSSQIGHRPKRKVNMPRWRL